jgi:hypothetical protein
VPLNKGEFILLFQPAEEGSAKVFNTFCCIYPDYVLPYILYLDIKKSDYSKNDTTCAVKIIIKLEGITAHAGEPEKGSTCDAKIITITYFYPADILKEKLFQLFILQKLVVMGARNFIVRSDSNGKMRTIETTLEHIKHMKSQMNTALSVT